MAELRAAPREVFDFLAGPAGLPPRSIERIGERIRTRLPAGWPAVTPGRARAGTAKLEVDAVHLVFLLVGTAGAPTIDAAPDACRLFVPMLSEAAFPVDLGPGVARHPAAPDPLKWSLGRFLYHGIVNQIAAADVTFSLTAPAAEITVRETDDHLLFGPTIPPDGKMWLPRYMSAVVGGSNPALAMRTLRSVPGELIAGLGGLLREVEDAPPVRQGGTDRLDDLQVAA